MRQQYSIYLNGSYFNADQPVLRSKNRAFLYGDALFETMLSSNGAIPFLNDHVERLQRSMEILKMRIPFNFNTSFFENETGRLLRRNKFFKWSRIRITVFRNEGGFYTPDTNDVSLLIECSPLAYNKFVVSREGMAIDAYTEHFKPVTRLSAVKSTNALLFVLAGNYRKENNLDECIILNQKRFVCETISSNIFLVKNSKIYTPSFSTACLPGVMRKQVINLILENNIIFSEVDSITLDHIAEADEVFITNAVSGIKWVSMYRDSRYFNKMSSFLVNELNKLVV